MLTRIPVVLVSRCSNGIAEDIYDYAGGGVGLKNGVVLPGLNGPKARIRLIVGLNSEKSCRVKRILERN